MIAPTLETLAERLEKLERQNRRLKRLMLLGGFFLVLVVGGLGYQVLNTTWQSEIQMGNMVLHGGGTPLSLGERVQLATGGLISTDREDRLRGSIGVRRKYAGVSFDNRKQRKWVELGIGEEVASMSFGDSTRVASLIHSYVENGEMVLDFHTLDWQQGIRIGLDANQQPLFEVVQDGVPMSLLDRPVSEGLLNWLAEYAQMHDVAVVDE